MLREREREPICVSPPLSIPSRRRRRFHSLSVTVRSG